jgi:LysM repeat protein
VTPNCDGRYGWVAVWRGPSWTRLGLGMAFGVAVLGLAALTLGSPRPAFAEEQEYTIQPGDTLTAIAGQFGVTVSRIVLANDIDDANVISSGAVLLIPDPGAPAVAYYTVVSGDWLSRIARDFGSSVESLVAANNIGDKNLIFPAGKLLIPVGDGTGTTAFDDGLAGADAFYTVEPGDTLSNIAAEFDTSRDVLAEVNEIADINWIFSGQRLRLPSG